MQNSLQNKNKNTQVKGKYHEIVPMYNTWILFTIS